MRTIGLSCIGIFILAAVVLSYDGLAYAADAGDNKTPNTPSSTPNTPSTGNRDATGAASDTSPAGKPGSSLSSVSAKPPVGTAPVYAPPRRGRPRARVGGGVRGTGPKLPTLRALVPDHVALTARSQPTLLWYLSELPPGEVSLMFNLTNEDEIDPLISAKLETPTRAGIQRILLANYDFNLETGQEYEWSVALVADSESRARDLVTLGWIERVENVAQGWIERVDEPEVDAAAQPDAATLAAAGLWYDAVDVANRDERAVLLGQVGLEPAGLP